MKNIKGLSEKEAQEKLKRYGKNEIIRKKKIGPLKLFLSQLNSPIIILLITTAIISFLINFFKNENFIDSILILAIVFASSIAGFLQDYKAEKTIEALQEIATPVSTVIREGKEKQIKANKIVPGDIIVIRSGDVIPADATIIKGNIEVNESILTGESKAVIKKINDKIFSGCSIYTGEAIAKVFATGMNTKIGEIATKMQEIKEEQTVFQKHMKSFTRKIVGFTSLIIVITFAIALKKFSAIEALLIAVSLAVAAIPEDLPAVITIALSIGAKSMAKKNALIRKLSVAESIGTIDVICTDKTGTLTEGEMKVKSIWLLKKEKYLALKCCYYCNDAKKIFDKNREKWIGDETDIALKKFSSKSVKEDAGILKKIPFTPERKMMSVVIKDKKNKKFVLSKGAPETILKKCTVSRKIKNKILEKNKEFACKGYRVLALAYKKYSEPIEKNLKFIGLVLLLDPPRKGVKKAISECYSAGIRIIMITGDHPLTAKAIAKEVGIKTNGILTGNDIDKIDNKKLEEYLNNNINIFARTTPFHKLRILELLQRKHVVAMSGDGVNDALALKKANIGISMGIKGTEVAKEASDIILLDDDFSTIRNAVKEGRRIFDNIRKFVDYLFTCNVAEVIVVLLTISLLPFISLFPIQILWINLITDGLPALALSIDPPRPDVMRRKPRKKNEGVINKKLALLIIYIGIKKAAIILTTFLITLYLTNNVNIARTTLFTSFILYEFIRISVIRYNEKLNSIKDWFSNKFLIYALLSSLILQLLIIYSPLSTYFKVVPLGILEWFILILGTVVGFIAGIGIAKFIDKIIKEEY